MRKLEKVNVQEKLTCRRTRRKNGNINQGRKEKDKQQWKNYFMVLLGGMDNATRKKTENDAIDEGKEISTEEVKRQIGKLNKKKHQKMKKLTVDL